MADHHFTGTPAADPHGSEHLIGAILQETLNRKRIHALVALSWNGPQLWVYSCSLGFGQDPTRVERLSGALALAAGASSCRVSRAPGKLLIEIPKPPDKRQVLSPERMDALSPKTPTAVPLGVSTGGRVAWLDLADSNSCHLAIGGATGSGKSVLLHWVLYRLCRQNAPQSMRLILLDPKGYELAPFASVPHLLHPITSHPFEIARLLAWVTGELDRRSTTGVARPRIVVVVDEARDLVSSLPDIGGQMARIAQIGRALGIHLVVSTQQPGGRSLGEALPNLPARLLGRVASATLTYGAAGRANTAADTLLGKGDFLLLTAGGDTTRLQIPLIGEAQFKRLARTEHPASLEGELPGLVSFGGRAHSRRRQHGRQPQQPQLVAEER